MQARLIARIHADVLGFPIDDIRESVEGWPTARSFMIDAGQPPRLNGARRPASR
jgi:hypothetical protein